MTDFVLGQRKLEKDREAGVVRRARGRPKGSTKKSPTSASSPESTVALIQPFRICEVNSATVTTFMDQLFTSVNNGLKTGHPRADLLLSLTQFNAFRAMMQNISSLGLTLEIMKDPESISTFNTKTQIGTLPPSLQPTALQSAIPHHPWIDPFPIPSFRDALLLQDGAYDEDAFCNDLLGECGSPSGQVGIIVWGDHPFDPMGYEMTEAFAKKWAWLLQGCWELKASTDYWRRSRGERPIFEVEELE